jgi:hypothetical protein
LSVPPGLVSNGRKSEGPATGVPFSLVTLLLGKQKKVTSIRAAPGEKQSAQSAQHHIFIFSFAGDSKLITSASPPLPLKGEGGPKGHPDPPVAIPTIPDKCRFQRFERYRTKQVIN